MRVFVNIYFTLCRLFFFIFSRGFLQVHTAFADLFAVLFVVFALFALFLCFVCFLRSLTLYTVQFPYSFTDTNTDKYGKNAWHKKTHTKNTQKKKNCMYTCVHIFKGIHRHTCPCLCARVYLFTCMQHAHVPEWWIDWSICISLSACLGVPWSITQLTLNGWWTNLSPPVFFFVDTAPLTRCTDDPWSCSHCLSLWFWWWLRAAVSSNLESCHVFWSHPCQNRRSNQTITLIPAHIFALTLATSPHQTSPSP